MRNINSKKYVEMLVYSSEILLAKKEEINALNVFPVPDGDTGSNMNMTYQAGVAAIQNKEFKTVAEVAKTFSKGLLMGARGNSGVILSQFFRGLSEGLEAKETIGIEELHEGLKSAVSRAYGSVIKAVEGTILTVAREMYENSDTNYENIIEYFERIVKEANTSLEGTPELLPVLKEVGVVDSGGAGLVSIFEGMLANLKGEKLKITNNSFEAFKMTEEHPMDPEEITFGFCTEMLIQLKDIDTDINQVRAKLETLGDSIVAIADEDILKVHVHTENPNEVFSYGRTLGEYIHLKSENMRIQAQEAQEKKEISQPKVKSDQELVVVASSLAMESLFKEIRSTIATVSGGQTLNPSIEDIAKAIEATHAKKVFVLPNNSNIIMAAKAAADLMEDIEVEVIETKYMSQAHEMIKAFNENASFQENRQMFIEMKDEVINYEITNAIRTTSVDGVNIEEGDYMIIANGKIKHSLANEKEAVYKVVNELLEIDVDIITIFEGEDADAELVAEIIEYIEEEMPLMEIEMHKTHQQVYSYIIYGVK